MVSRKENKGAKTQSLCSSSLPLCVYSFAPLRENFSRLSQQHRLDASAAVLPKSTRVRRNDESSEIICPAQKKKKIALLL
jgi:hypothetical protein